MLPVPYIQTIASGNIIDCQARVITEKDGDYFIKQSFTASTNNVAGFRLLVNNSQRSGKAVFNSIAIFKGTPDIPEENLKKMQNTKTYSVSDILDGSYKTIINNNTTRISNIEKKLEAPTTEKIIDLIGDSLTGGAYGANVIYKYENRLRELLPNWTINNYGAGSELANAISARSGGIQFFINKCELSTTPTKVTFVDGQYRSFFFTTSVGFYNYYLDDGTKIILTTKNESGIVNYAALESGTKSIKEPTRVYTDFITRDNSTHIAIICIGANGGINSEIDLTQQVKNIIEVNGYKKYLVLPENMSDINQKRDPLLRQNRYLNEWFGKNFVNSYDYMIKYGLSESEQTEADKTDISLNIIPESLRIDSIHYNAKGCAMQAELIYKRGKELGYW